MNYISLKCMQLLFPCSKCAYEQKHELLLMLNVRKAQLLPPEENVMHKTQH